MEKFVVAVQGKDEVTATGGEGVMAMKLLDAIYKSRDPARVNTRTGSKFGRKNRFL